MKWLTVGMKEEFVPEFKKFFRNNGVQYSDDVLRIDGICHILYKPIGKEQVQKCNQFIERQCYSNRI